MTEVYTGLQQLLHRYDCHCYNSLLFVFPPPRSSPGRPSFRTPAAADPRVCGFEMSRVKAHAESLYRMERRNCKHYFPKIAKNISVREKNCAGAALSWQPRLSSRHPAVVGLRLHQNDVLADALDAAPWNDRIVPPPEAAPETARGPGTTMAQTFPLGRFPPRTSVHITPAGARR